MIKYQGNALFYRHLSMTSKYMYIIIMICLNLCMYCQEVKPIACKDINEKSMLCTGCRLRVVHVQYVDQTSSQGHYVNSVGTHRMQSDHARQFP
jgi:thioredoxin-related protein